MPNIELLMPGGSLEKVKYAIAYGADAVYVGVPRYSLRARENEFFEIDKVKQAVDFVHGKGKKIYLTCNIYAHNNKVDAFMGAMSEMVHCKPDAFIMTDPGLIALTKEKFPDVEIHLSTQANNTNWAQVKFWKDFGIKRAILARELTVKEIREIHEKVPGIELEVFVHGSICMAYSGRCLLSNYLNYRDANQGTCSHTCRWGFNIYVNDQKSLLENRQLLQDDVITNYIPITGDFYLEEPQRKGEFMNIDEDEYGTYIMNSKDLCALDYLEDLRDAGVVSFKVEGRNKTEYYASIVAKAYRKAIDMIQDGGTIDRETRRQLLDEVSSTANRGFIPGFYARNAKAAAQELEKDTVVQTHLYAARVVNYDVETRVAELEVKNRLDKGDEIEVVLPSGGFKIVLDEMYYKSHPDYVTKHNQKLSANNNSQLQKPIHPDQIKPTEHAHGGGENIFIKMPQDIGTNWDATILRMQYKEPVSLRNRNNGQPAALVP